jgi:hypothetical protein
MEVGQDAAEALEPTAHGLFVVALTTNRVGASKPAKNLQRSLTYIQTRKIRFAAPFITSFRPRCSTSAELAAHSLTNERVTCAEAKT